MAEKSSKRARYSPESVESLVSSLERLKVSNPKAVNFQDHTFAPVGKSNHASTSQDGMHDERLASDSSEDGRRYIRSWKMSEHLYRRKDCPFPTLARGLFTATDDYALPSAAASLKGKEKVRIVARGYDKFFNAGEVDWTEWNHLERHSLPPYDLTYKSNGCLILISALSPTELMVSSKHSLGTTTVQKEEAEKVEGNGGGSREKPTNPKPVPESADHATSDVSITTAMQTICLDRTSKCTSEDATMSKNALKKQQKAEMAKAKREADKEAKSAQQEEATRRKEEAKHNREADDMVPHAEMGRRWVKITLDKARKTEEELAAVLWERNLTAVAELCDDSFEEHVLPTPDHLTGLHLHGLNLNTPHFATLDPPAVADFAKQWGFIETPSVQLQTLNEVREYTDRVSKEGTWNGEAIEGFVVRCRVKEVQSSTSRRDDGEPPYPPGSPFFFKVKFEEPYLMYRQWREITRQLLPLLRPECKGRTDRKAFPWTHMGAKLKRPESAVYATWCAEMMVKDPQLFDNYDKGVVKVRERFLEWTQSDGKQLWETAREKGGQGASSGSGNKKIKTMIVPVAAPGCGKTLLGLTLSRLFGFGHTQSDDVTTKRTAAGFLKNIETLLKKDDVVYCDRNNHLPKHHEELSNLAKSLSNDQVHVRPIALVWDVDSVPFNRALRITSERVLGRGENHQSLRPDPHDQMRHELVIKQFLNEFVPPEGGLFEQVIKMGLEKTLEENLKLAIEGLKGPLGLEVPSEEKIQEATESISGYKPTVKKEAQGRKTVEPRYYGLSLELDLQGMVQQIITAAQTASKEDATSAQTFLDELVAVARVISKPHITIVHEKSVAAEKETGQEGPQTRLWDTCASFRELPSPPRFNFDLVALLWDDRVMTLVVDNVQPHDRAGGSENDFKANEIEKVLCSELKDVLHVTVGTRDEGIPPVEARALVERWRKERGSEERSVRQLDIKDVVESGRVLGMS